MPYINHPKYSGPDSVIEINARRRKEFVEIEVRDYGDQMNATCSWTTKQGLEVLGAQFLLRQQVLA